MSTNERPEWAQGSEWDGWDVVGYHSDMVQRFIMDGLEQKYCAHISKVGLGVWDMFDENQGMEFSLSPKSALRIANAIAAEFGGWADTRQTETTDLGNELGKKIGASWATKSI
jgi:hypothetical protein